MFEKENIFDKPVVVEGINGMSYLLSDGVLFLNKVSESERFVTVPAYVDGYRVQGLTRDALSNTSAEYLGIEFGVTQMWAENLLNNNLKEVHLPSSMVAIVHGHLPYKSGLGESDTSYARDLAIYCTGDSQAEGFALEKDILKADSLNQPLLVYVNEMSLIDQSSTPEGYIRIDESSFVLSEVFSGSTKYTDEFSVFELNSSGVMEETGAKRYSLDIVNQYMNVGIDFSKKEPMQKALQFVDYHLSTEPTPSRLPHGSKGLAYELEYLGNDKDYNYHSAYTALDFEDDEDLESRYVHPIYEFKRSNKNSAVLVGAKVKLPANVELPDRIANLVVTSITRELFKGQEHIESLILPKNVVIVPNVVFTLPNLKNLTIQPYATVFEVPKYGTSYGDLIVTVGIESPALHYCITHSIPYKINPVLGKSLYDSILDFKNNPMLLKDSVRSRFHTFDPNGSLLVRFGFSSDEGESRYVKLEDLVLTRIAEVRPVYNSEGKSAGYSTPLDFIVEYLVADILNDCYDKSTADNDGFVFDSYDSEEGETALVAYVGSQKKVVVPSEYEGLNVTAISEGVFDSSVIEELIIPDSVTTVNYDMLHNPNIKHIGLSCRLSEINRGKLPVISDEQMRKIKYLEGSITDMTLNRFF